MIGNIIVVVTVTLCVALAIRSVVKSRKSGGCNCGCEECSPDSKKFCGK